MRIVELPTGSAAAAPPSSVAGVVLAGGCSRRFGGNKLLAPFRGKPLLRWVVEAALQSRLARVVVVLGHEHDQLREVLADFTGEKRLTFTINESYRLGQSASVVAGLSALPPGSAAAMFLVGDQPLLDSRVIDRLIAAFEASGGICFPSCGGRRCNPVVFASRFFPELRRLRGDTGGRLVMEANRDAVVPVAFADEAPFRDVDHRADLEVLLPQGSAPSLWAAHTSLVRALGLGTSRVISLCGAGGKTGLMSALVRELAANGDERILATTTTKMGTDEAEGPWRACQTADAADLLGRIDRAPGPVLAYHFTDHEQCRLRGFPAGVVDELAKRGRFTRILVEADGSRRRPLKAPSAQEPVFAAATDAVVMVSGAGGLMRPLDDDTVFRPDCWSGLTGLRISDPITPESLARVVVHPEGLARGAPARARRMLFLNQADTPDRLTASRAVLDWVSMLGGRIPERAVIGRLQPEPQVCELREFGAREPSNTGEGT